MDDLPARDSQHLHANRCWSRVSLFLIAAEGQSDLLWCGGWNHRHCTPRVQLACSLSQWEICECVLPPK